MHADSVATHDAANGTDFLVKRKITITMELTFPSDLSQLKLAAANRAIEFITDMFHDNTVKVLEYHNITVDGWAQLDQPADHQGV